IGFTMSLRPEISSTATLEPRTMPFLFAQLLGREINTVPPPISRTFRVSIKSIEFYRLFIDYLDIVSAQGSLRLELIALLKGGYHRDRGGALRRREGPHCLHPEPLGHRRVPHRSLHPCLLRRRLRHGACG